MASRASEFRELMVRARAVENSRPSVEVATGLDRIRAAVTDAGTLKLRAITISQTSGSDSDKIVEVSGAQALALARFILDTFGEPDEKEPA